MAYNCPECKSPTIHGNDAKLLVSLPEYVRNAYPVDPRYATGTFHLDRDCTEMLDEIMPTFGNGDMLSRLLYSRINKDYLRRFTEYLSYWKAYQIVAAKVEGIQMSPPKYPEKDGDFITAYPPPGDALRDLFDHACSTNLTSYGVSDHDRCTREMQSVGTNSMFAQDHTMEMVKNYKKEVGAHAAWDCATETGEIASVVLVGSTSVEDIAHAVESMSRRPNFKPSAMYSDTWPHKDKFWKMLFGPALEGRLGLFHYQQRIVKTLRQGHIDYHRALRELCECIYYWEEHTFEALLNALLNGLMGKSGDDPKTHSEITAMQNSAAFKRKYGKYLMKCIRPANQIRQRLDA